LDDAAVLVSLSESGADDARLDTLTRQLGGELRQLDVRDVRPVSTGLDAPPGSRGFDVGTVGQLAVALVGTQGLTGLVTAVLGWLHRGPPAARTVRLEIGGDVLELTDASSEEQDRLVAIFIDKHAAKD
jgi:hypothetical protein